MATAVLAGDLLSRDEIARRLNRHKKTIANWEKHGLPVIKIGKRTRLYSLPAVERWLSAAHTAGKKRKRAA
jgi:phage terminase Nu1 subunit (DNA packaging protein)